MSSVDLMPYLPAYYHEIVEFKELLSTQGEELGDLWYDSNSLLEQMSISTATWGLAKWESELGLAIDINKPIDQRRSVIRSRLRGVGTVNKALIKSVAESYANGEVEVIEYTKNLLPPLSQWVVASGITVIEPYTATINAVNGTDRIAYVDVTVGKNIDYYFNLIAPQNSVMGIGLLREIAFSVTNVAGNVVFIPFNGTVGTFNTGNVDKIRISIKNAPGFTGPTRFSNPQIGRGTFVDPFSPRKIYTVGIRFVSTLGIPENLADIKKAIRDIVPAHLAVEYLFSYVTFGMLSEIFNTFGDIETVGITFGQIETYGGGV
ncbi:putative phage tail protein [Paenibacillus eucommiae]|uniref:DUF2313 domain-containing protein n=1 Tax=Paenibacillus eucommiae TaxID=1355755 RepID=A0ABS4IRK7_9BACL|nr:putative phage tail protein [Paenibacillus eucommiae]MBP1990202.1 hypothetical protein [Paenibacillus eucommiae]